MKQLFLNAVSGANPEALQGFAMLIAVNVRNGMEQFHVENLSDAQMKQLNPLIRNSIYEALLAIAKSNKNINCARIVDFLFKSIPPYWEMPELEENTLAFMEGSGTEEDIIFKSAFLSQEFEKGNIIFNKLTGCLEIIHSAKFKKITLDNHSHRNKLGAALRKEGYYYRSSLLGYSKGL